MPAVVNPVPYPLTVSADPDLTLSVTADAQQDGRTLVTEGATPGGGTGAYTYAWTLTGPDGTDETAKLSDATVAAPTWTPDAAGAWVATCAVTSGAQTTYRSRQVVVGRVAYPIDWTSQPTTDIKAGGAGPYVFGGVTWTAGAMTNCDAFGVINGIGLRGYDATAGTRYAQLLIDLASLCTPSDAKRYCWLHHVEVVGASKDYEAAGIWLKTAALANLDTLTIGGYVWGNVVRDITDGLDQYVLYAANADHLAGIEFDGRGQRSRIEPWAGAYKDPAEIPVAFTGRTLSSSRATDVLVIGFVAGSPDGIEVIFKQSWLVEME